MLLFLEILTLHMLQGRDLQFDNYVYYLVFIVENLQLTKAVLCAGLYPNVATIVSKGGAYRKRYLWE